MTGCAKTSSMAASESPASRSMTTKNAAYCSAGSSRYLAASAHFRDDCRIVFKLRDIEKLSTQETAETLAIPIQAAKCRLLKARLTLGGVADAFAYLRTIPSGAGRLSGPELRYGVEAPS